MNNLSNKTKKSKFGGNFFKIKGGKIKISITKERGKSKMEIYHIDIDELNKQRKEEIINSKEYLGLEVYIAKGDCSPLATLCLKDVSDIEIAMLLSVLEEFSSQIKEEFPEANDLYNECTED